MNERSRLGRHTAINTQSLGEPRTLCLMASHPYWVISYSRCSIIMRNSRRIAGYAGRIPRYLSHLRLCPYRDTHGCIISAHCNGGDDYRVEDIAALANSALMLTVVEGPFIMGTARTSYEPFSFDLQYDDTSSHSAAFGSISMKSIGTK